MSYLYIYNNNITNTALEIMNKELKLNIYGKLTMGGAKP